MSTKKRYGLRDLERRFGPLTFGMLIKSFRECDEISQTEYAKKLGLSRANLCDIERGRKHVSVQRAVRIARKLGLSEAWLVQLAIQDVLRAAKLKYKVELSAA